MEFLTIALAHAIAVASPGPDFALVLKTSLAKGHRAGAIAALGIASGISLHMFYCIVGLELIQSYFQSYFIYASYCIEDYDILRHNLTLCYCTDSTQGSHK